MTWLALIAAFLLGVVAGVLALAILVVLGERRRQDAKWGIASTEPRWYWTDRGRAAVLEAMEESNATR